MVFGNGNDVVKGTARDDVVVLGGGDDVFTDLKRGKDTVCGGSGADRIFTGSGNDVVVAGAGEDSIDGGRGSDELHGGRGFDDLTFKAAGLVVDLTKHRSTSASGKDSFDGFEQYFGSTANDTFLGSPGRDAITGMGGADMIKGNGGDDELDVWGAAKAYGGPGNDTINARDQAQAWGGDGNDTLSTDLGTAGLFGGAGADQFWVAEATPTVDGNDGVDRLGVFYFVASATIDLAAGTVVSSAGPTFTALNIEDVLGTKQGDTIYGTDEPNAISGGDGDDKLYGRGGDDTLTGDNGIDLTDGGPGADDCYTSETITNC